MVPPKKKPTYGRWRALSLATVYLLIGIHIIHWKLAGRTLAPLEVSEVLQTVHLGIITAGAVFMVATLLLTLVLGRFFCGWACHMLALQDLCAWLLAKIGIRPKPIRSRMLIWIPFLAVFYLFFWPHIDRMISGQSFPGFRLEQDAGGWGSFVTDDMWRNLPGIGIMLLTFCVCGFLIVYLLGTRSFCRYACPYGALYNIADRVAPGRIVLTGDCQQCALCTATCHSQVRVHEEIKKYGMVVDSNCMKDLDCVAQCPNSAIEFGMARPPLLRGIFRPLSRRLPYSFSLAEDVLVAVVFLATFAVYRGLYDALPFLLSMSIAIILAYGSVVCVRLIRDGSFRANKLVLKASGKLTPIGGTFIALAVFVGGFTIHGGFVRYHDFAGQRAYRQAVAFGTEAESQGVFSPSAWDAAHRALYHLGMAHDWGFVKPLRLRRQLAALHIGTASLEPAERQLRAIVDESPHDPESLQTLAALLAKQGKLEESLKFLLQCAQRTPDAPAVQSNLGLVYSLLGDDENARIHRQRSADLSGHRRSAP